MSFPVMLRRGRGNSEIGIPFASLRIALYWAFLSVLSLYFLFLYSHFANSLLFGH